MKGALHSCRQSSKALRDCEEYEDDTSSILPRSLRHMQSMHRLEKAYCLHQRCLKPAAVPLKPRQ